ncbi:lactonase family protein [Marinobacter sp. LN3S78]|uniref:lactonase family protein n=1 Tax=Marinobacter sp. LN3S78 TaxID=3382300 RepID=UPI00387B69DD
MNNRTTILSRILLLGSALLLALQLTACGGSSSGGSTTSGTDTDNNGDNGGSGGNTSDSSDENDSSDDTPASLGNVERYALVTSYNNQSLSSYAVHADSGMMRLADKIPNNSSAVSVALRPGHDETLVLSSGAAYHYTLDARGQLTSENSLPLGNDLRDVVIHPSGQSLYIADHNDMGLYQLTFDDDGELEEMPNNFVGPDYLGAGYVDLAMGSNGQQVYAADNAQDSISRFDVASDGSLTYVDSIAAGDGPWRMALHADTQTLYAINRLDGTLSQYRIQEGGSLEFLGLADDGGENIFEVGQLEGVSLDNSGQFLYVSDNTNDKVWQFGITDDGTLEPLPGYAIDVDNAVSPGNLMASPTSDRMYLADHNAGAILTFDIGEDGTLSPATPNRLPVDGFPTDMVFTTGEALTAHNTAAYVVNSGNDNISQFLMDDDGTMTALGDTNPLTGDNPSAIATHPTGKYLYVANTNDNTVSQFRRATAIHVDKEEDELVAIDVPVATDLEPVALAVHPSGNFLYVISKHNNTVSLHNINSYGALSEYQQYPVGHIDPVDLSIDPTGRYLWAVNNDDPALIVPFAIDTLDGSLTKLDVKPTIANARAIAVSADGQTLYTAGNGLEKFLVDDDGSLASEGTMAGNGGIHLLMSPAHTLYAVNEVAQSIAWLSEEAGFDGLITDSVPAGPGLAPNGQQLLLALKGNQMVSRFNVAGDGSLTAVESIAVGNLPVDVSIVGYTE